MALFTDKHSQHVRDHRAIVSTPQLRLTDPDLVLRVNAHIQEHIELLRTTDPAVLALFGEQPIGPVQGSPPSVETMAPNTPSKASMDLTAPLQPSPKASLPQPATPPEAAPNGMPIDPKKMGQNNG